MTKDDKQPKPKGLKVTFEEKPVHHLGRLTPELLKMLKERENVKNSPIDDLIKFDHLKVPPRVDLPNLDLPPSEPFFDFNFLELTIADVRSLPTDELLMLLSGESHGGMIRDSTLQLISNELLIRQIKESAKPHWTVYVGVVLALIAAVTGIIQLLNSN